MSRLLQQASLQHSVLLKLLYYAIRRERDTHALSHLQPNIHTTPTYSVGSDFHSLLIRFFTGIHTYVCGSKSLPDTIYYIHMHFFAWGHRLPLNVCIWSHLLTIDRLDEDIYIVLWYSQGCSMTIPHDACYQRIMSPRTGVHKTVLNR